MKLVPTAGLTEMRRFLVLTMVLACLAGCGPGVPSTEPETGYSLDHGVIKGARFALAVPNTWSGRLLVIAHGYRPAKAPLLAVLDPTDPYVTELLADGWLVATTHRLKCHLGEPLEITPSFDPRRKGVYH